MGLRDASTVQLFNRLTGVIDELKGINAPISVKLLSLVLPISESNCDLLNHGSFKQANVSLEILLTLFICHCLGDTPDSDSKPMPLLDVVGPGGSRYLASDPGTPWPFFLMSAQLAFAQTPSSVAFFSFQLLFFSYPAVVGSLPCFPKPFQARVSASQSPTWNGRQNWNDQTLLSRALENSDVNRLDNGIYVPVCSVPSVVSDSL